MILQGFTESIVEDAALRDTLLPNLISGELRMVGQMPNRLREAAKLGFKSAIVPRGVRRSEPWPDGIDILQARSLREALNFALLEKAG